MGKIVRINKELHTVLGNDGIGFHSRWKVGELFYVEPYESVKGTNNYYPFNGGYPIWDRQVDMQNFTELVEETDKPRGYYLDRIYTQEYVDNLMKDKQ